MQPKQPVDKPEDKHSSSSSESEDEKDDIDNGFLEQLKVFIGDNVDD